MGNITSYLRKYRNISFDQKPFNYIDNLILSTFVYNDFSSVYYDGITIGEAVKKKFNNLSSYIKPIGLILPSLNIVELAIVMSHSLRFKNLKIINRVDILNENCQFCAHLFSCDNFNYIAFRGTDDSIAGWLENIESNFNYPVNSQREAQKYLDEVLPNLEGRVYIGGHSKGGNLAIYGYLHTLYQDKVTKVFNNDGQGIKREFIDCETEIAKKKIVKIAPKHSIVGNLFESIEGKRIICKCGLSGIVQHDPFLWKVKDSFFIECEKYSHRSLSFVKKFFQDVDKLTIEEQKKFYLDVKEFFESGNISFLLETANARKLLKALRKHPFDRQSKKILNKMIKAYLFR